MNTPALVVIPARGGSKGVPRKNLRRVGGRTLVDRAVTTARAATLVDHVVVSTDDSDVAAEARRAGASVRDRPERLADDHASSESAVLDVLDHLPNSVSAASVTALLQCTSPLLTPDDVDATLRPVVDGTADAAFSASPFHGFVWQPDAEGVAQGRNHDPAVRQRRQDRPTEHLETGGVYAFTTRGFRHHQHRFFGRTVAVPISSHPVEVDTPADLQLARALANLQPDPRPPMGHPELLVLDFDGVFTDNRVLVDQDGHEAVLCHRGDGLAVQRLKQAFPVVVLSSERNPVVAARCDKLGLPYVQGVDNGKAAALQALLDHHGVDPADTLYLGNDVNDLPCLQAVGYPVVVADAEPAARAAADIVLDRAGGSGALIELAARLGLDRRALQDGRDG